MGKVVLKKGGCVGIDKGRRAGGKVEEEEGRLRIGRERRRTGRKGNMKEVGKEEEWVVKREVRNIKDMKGEK